MKNLLNLLILISLLFSTQLNANTKSNHSIKNIISYTKEKTYHFDITVYYKHPDNCQQIFFEYQTIYIKARDIIDAHNKLDKEMSRHIISLDKVGTFCECKARFTWESQLIE